MIDQVLDQKIQQWIKENREEILQQWMDLVRIPSVRGEAEPLAPFGKECARAVHQAAGYYRKAEIPVRIEEGVHYALADLGEGDTTIALFGHSDVVPAGDGWLYTEPFEPVIRDGYLIGRGVGDNKSGVMASLGALRLLKDCKIPLRSRVRAFIGSNEESGMGDMAVFLKKEEMPTLALVPDSAYPCCLGEKSILRLIARQEKPLQDILSFEGGQALNVVLDYVKVTLRPVEALWAELAPFVEGKKEYTLTREKDWYQLEAFGAAKHAGSPEGSLNAAYLAAKALAQCQSLNPFDRSRMEEITLWLGDIHGSGLGIAHEDPDFGPLTSANGLVKTEEGRLSLGLDIRFGITRDHLETEAHLKKLFEASGWHFTFLNNRKGFSCDPNSPYPPMLTRLYQELTGSNAKPYRMAGGTYSRYLKNTFTVGGRAFVPNSTSVCPPMPKDHGGAHQRDEAIEIDAMFQAIRVLVHYIVACDELLHSEK